MLSRCPACATVFRVDTVQIRAREGRVRCGRCHAVFDALDAMVEVPAPKTAPHAGVGGGVTGTALPAIAEIPTESRATLNVLDAPDVDVRAEAAAVTTDFLDPGEPDTQPLPQPGGSMEALVERTTDYWNTRLAGGSAHDSAPPRTGDARVDIELDIVPDTASDHDSTSTQALDIAATDAAPEAPPEHASQAPDDAETGHDPLLDPPPALEAVRDPAVQRIRRELYGVEAVVPRSSLRTALWGFGCLLLVLLAAAQLAYHFRTDIALAQPSLKSLLEQACAGLGCTLPAPRQPDRISIESSELTPEAGREPLLRLSALLRNRAGFAQAWPHLELTLTDTADRAVVRRVLAPTEFLSPATHDAGFAADSEHSISLLIDPADSGAGGYRLYAFYP